MSEIVNTVRLETQGLVFINEAYIGGNEMPTGLICMWSGLKANIPTGWNLCDGSNGTPDLRDRFILSVGSDEAGTTGGNLNLTHSGVTVGDHAAKNTGVADVGATKIGTTASTATLKAHIHSITAYIHAVTQSSDHSDIRPPFYKLAFIMRV